MAAGVATGAVSVSAAGVVSALDAARGAAGAGAEALTTGAGVLETAIDRPGEIAWKLLPPGDVAVDTVVGVAIAEEVILS